nr:isoform 3 of beta-glucosidase 11 [Quercus suber]
MLRLLFLQIFVLNLAVGVPSSREFSRDDFPPDFVFGSGTSAYQEDVQLMVDIGLDAYRFSISWSRLIPRIQPHVTLHNYDLTQALEDKRDFIEYAEVCFREFGDRVSFWTTINEPNAFVYRVYDLGFLPPQRCSPPYGNCSRGNSSSEQYIAAHNTLLAHASVARLYQKKYQDKQHGLIGLSINMQGFVPLTDTKEDAIATQRAYAFNYGWFLNPLVFGDYPNIMKQNMGARMLVFTDHESKLVKGSFDFIGVIHYISMYVKDISNGLKMVYRDIFMDVEIELIGQRMQRNSTLDDIARVKYMHGYIGGVLDALRHESNTRGYFTWAFLDIFELIGGYGYSYGINYVDLDDPDLKRYPKLSAKWYSNFLKGRSINLDGVIELEKNL